MRFIKRKYEHLYEIKSPEKFDKQGKPKPVSIIGMDIDDLKDINIDVFETIKYKVYQVAYGYAKSLLITGQGGLGKSYDTEKALKETGKDYYSISGGISTAGLFELLFRRNGEIILFDDCDSVFDNPESINILKAALDSKPVRKISREIKTHFDTKGMTMKDIMANYLGDRERADNPHLFKSINQGRLPKSFTYTGRIIFISNLKGSEIDPTIITRVSAHVDVDLTHDEIMSRMRKIMKAVHKNVPMEKKEEVLRLVDYLSTNFVTRHPISIRGLINAIETRVANEFTTKIGGREIPMWQLLIKQDMLGKNPVRKPKD